MHETPIDIGSLPILSSSGIYYTRMQAYMLSAGALQRPQAVACDTGALLAKTLEALPPNTIFVIDCRHISFIDHHALEPLSRVLSYKKSSLLMIDTASISSSIADAIKSPHRSDIEMSKYRVTFCGQNSPPDPSAIEAMLSDFKKSETAQVFNAVKSSIVTFSPRRLASTPLITTVAYDARKILSSPTHFIWTALLLADELRSILSDLRSVKSPVLMAVSLRASPFAVVASALNSTPCEIIDHMGPTPRILEEQPVIGSCPQAEAIYLGDFCIGGTEIRIAQTYALLRGRVMRRALLIGCVVNEPHAFAGIETRSLTRLDEVSPDVKYTL